MNNTIVTCPVSSNRVNENAVRVTAFFTILVTLTGVAFKSPVILSLLAFDFFVRAFTSGKYSVLKILSKRISDYAGLEEKFVDAAPKKFAAGIGFLFSAAIALSFFLDHTITAYSLAEVLLICAGLESFKGFCLGCIVYTILVAPFISKSN